MKLYLCVYIFGMFFSFKYMVIIKMQCCDVAIYMQNRAVLEKYLKPTVYIGNFEVFFNFSPKYSIHCPDPSGSSGSQ